MSLSSFFASDTYKSIEYLFYNNRYTKYEFDLTVARTDHLVDFSKDLGTSIRELVVQRADDTAYIKINAISNASIEADPALRISKFKINRIYITNPASAVSGAKLVILVYWRE